MPHYVRQATCRNRAYAEQHGYAYKLIQSRHPRLNYEFNDSWQKLAYLLDMAGDVDKTVIAMDADIQIVDDSQTLDNLLAPCGNASLVMTTDVNLMGDNRTNGCCRYQCKCILNGGLVILRAAAWDGWGRQLLQRMMQPKAACGGPGRNFHRLRQWDQDCFQMLLNQGGHLPDADAIRRAHSLRGSPARSADGRVCLLPQPLVAPLLPQNKSRPVVPSAEAREHSNFLRSSLHPTNTLQSSFGRPFSFHVILNCQRARGSAAVAWRHCATKANLARQLNGIRYAQESTDKLVQCMTAQANGSQASLTHR